MRQSGSSFLVGAFFAIALAGCLGDDVVEPAQEEPGDSLLPPGTPTYQIRCRVLDVDRAPPANATCLYQFGALRVTVPVNDEGVAEYGVPVNATGKLRATAPYHIGRNVSLTADGNKSVEIILAKLGGTTGEDPAENETGLVLDRWRWDTPVAIASGGNEPHVAVAEDGTIYYAPTSTLWRSKDGGKTWENVSPVIPEALPTLGSDTSLSIAPDGSVWWSRYWGYADTTIGCTSTDRGDSWTCDNAAIPGITDRMWIVGLDENVGYLQTNEGLYHHVWARTDTGSQKYVPHASTTTLLAVRNGNMVYDEKNDAVWQVEWVGSRLQLMRIDTATGLVASQDTGIPSPYALPWISVRDGVLWTTGEPVGPGGSRGLVVARSDDQGRTWTKFPVTTAAKSITFSYVAAGPDGRVAVVYYGSDKAGASTSNGGNWSVYVSETSDGLSEDPTWVETQIDPLIHVGNICIGLSCEQTGGDTQARFSGDLIGAWIDETGSVHVAYNEKVGNAAAKDLFARQWPAD